MTAAFYVVCHDGPRVGWLLGPFADHETAIDLIEPARAEACRLNAMSHFYSFGTARVEGGTRPGTLNALFGLREPGDTPVVPARDAKPVQGTMDFAAADEEDDIDEPDWAGMIARGAIDV